MVGQHIHDWILRVKFAKRDFLHKNQEQTKKSITFKPLRESCSNFTQKLKRNNRTTYEIFILVVIMLCDVTHTSLK